uniref:Uncharacterized protein n=1 Tax=Rhizophora mucronata TaxID=61149 RepID=A0A2P2N7U3_RHIMU
MLATSENCRGILLCHINFLSSKLWCTFVRKVHRFGEDYIVNCFDMIHIIC